MGNKSSKSLTYHGGGTVRAGSAEVTATSNVTSNNSAPNASQSSRKLNIQLSDFELLRSVGHGTFGHVMLVRRYSNGRTYALKYISKAQCVRQKAVMNVIAERRILQRLSHPLVCNLQAAFQDDEHLYIVLDPMLGGDLAFHLERCEFFPEEVVKFYVCEIALALRYLHKQYIVHRDVKPANILLDERGHCHLTDFNVAGRIRRGQPMKSFAGTYSYMAPEVFKQKGYYESVDWWSLGVTMFELLYGKVPFRGKTKREIGEAVLQHEIVYPRRNDIKISPLCSDALHGFLTPKARDRLGCKYRPFKEHPYFADVDWDKMSRKELSSPFKPDPALVKTDMLFQLEEVLLNEPPLMQKRKKKADKPKTYPPDSPWQLMLDEFKDFDRVVWEQEQRERRRLRAMGHTSSMSGTTYTSETTSHGHVQSITTTTTSSHTDSRTGLSEPSKVRTRDRHHQSSLSDETYRPVERSHRITPAASHLTPLRVDQAQLANIYQDRDRLQRVPQSPGSPTTQHSQIPSQLSNHKGHLIHRSNTRSFNDLRSRASTTAYSAALEDDKRSEYDDLGNFGEDDQEGSDHQSRTATPDVH